MLTEKHFDKKNKIIEAAFLEWGKDNYKNSSLTDIAKKLKMTKPALYRYFKSKEELLSAMKDYLIDITIKNSLNFLNESRNLEQEKIIKKYVESYFMYFLKNIKQFLFFVQFVVRENRLQKNQSFLTIATKIIEVFKNIDELKSYTDQQIMHFMRFSFSTGVFVLMHSLFKNSNEYKKNIDIFSETEIECIIEKIAKISNNALKNKIAKDIDFSKIEISALVYPEELPKRDKIFEAIATVVAKEGIWGASVGRIASELKMSKSSLYFYFNNKKDMFRKMLMDEMIKRNEVLFLKSLPFENFEEKVYAIIIALVTYFLLDTRILNVFDWLHYQGRSLKMLKEFHNKKIELPEFIIEIFSGNKYYKTDFETTFVYQYLTIQIIKEILLSFQDERELDIKEMRVIYRYFINGLFKGENL